MMAGNPNWWTMNPHESVFDNFPIRSWSQFLLDDGENRTNKMENWEEDQVMNLNPLGFPGIPFIDVKEELEKSHRDFRGDSWLSSSSSPSSCVTKNSVLSFSGGNSAAAPAKNREEEHSLERDGIRSDGGSKKARVHNSSSQPMLKVRKEKLGDRITALHQLVSPFGKTDTASVLSEAIGYIRFLQSQIEALSSPYMRNQHCESKNGLRSRGLCLVPISCTHNVGNDAGVDFWPPPSSLGGGGGSGY